MLVDFGIGEVLTRRLDEHSQLMRGSGRTEQIAEMVRAGDRVIFSSEDHKREFEDVLKRKEIEGVDLKVVAPRGDFSRLLGSTPQGRVFFDHVWIEQYYKSHLDDLQIILDRMQRDFSGYWRAHQETKQDYQGRMRRK